MFDIKITYSNGFLDIQNELENTIQAAISWLSQYIVFNGTIDIDIVVEETSTGRFGGSGSTSYIGNIDGIDTYGPALAEESITGLDPDLNAPDLFIFIDPDSDYLPQLWWDPSPLTFTANEIPNDKTDAFTVVLHEILHGMGVSGWTNIETGKNSNNYQSLWDSKLTLSDGHAFFTGANTLDLLGEPVEVRLGGTQGAFHLGAQETQQPILESSNLNGYYYFLGER